MKNILKTWITRVLKGMATSKKANGAAGGGILALFLPQIMTALNLEGNPSTLQMIVAGLAAVYVYSQGQADHGKEGVAAGIKRDMLAALTTNTRMIAPVADFTKVFKAIGIPEDEAKALEESIMGNPVASGQVEELAKERAEQILAQREAQEKEKMN